MHQCMHVPFARIYIPLSQKKNETLGGGLKLQIFLEAKHLHHLYTFSTWFMPAYKRYTLTNLPSSDSSMKVTVEGWNKATIFSESPNQELSL